MTLGAVFGLLVALLLYVIRPTIMSMSQLRQLTGLPVLGSVAMKNNMLQVESNKKELLKYSATILGLLTIYISFMMIDILEIKVEIFSKLLQLLK